MLVVMLGSNDRQPLRDEAGAHEFGTERWKELYQRRIDDLLAVAREKRWPVLMVGMPVMQESRLSAGMLVVNGLIRERAQRAGWFSSISGGFATEKGEYASTGPDVNGATVRLRTSDGILFTRAGARKLGFFVGKEVIERLGREQPPAIAALPNDLSEQIRRELPASAPLAAPAGSSAGSRCPSCRVACDRGPPSRRTRAGAHRPPQSPGGVLLRGRVLMPSTEMGIIVEQAFAYGRAPAAKPGGRMISPGPAGRPTGGTIPPSAPSARQLALAHEELVDRARGLTAFADRPDHEALAAAHVAGGEDLVERGAIVAVRRLDVAARVRGDRELLHHPSCTGWTKPMASSTRSAFSSNSVPGTGLKSLPDWAQISFATLPLPSPSKRTVATANWRSAPS